MLHNKVVSKMFGDAGYLKTLIMQKLFHHQYSLTGCLQSREEILMSHSVLIQLLLVR